VGVFLAFTLSQAGTVVHWWRRRTTGWRTSIFFNGFGCLCAAIVLVVIFTQYLQMGLGYPA
jgi:hypothetical protein